MQFQCLGGFREVGRNALLADTEGKKLMFDFGSKVETGDVPKLPKGKTDALFITHGHLDHLGAAPYLHKQNPFKTYVTAPTADYCDLLLRDSLKVARLKGFPIRYSPGDILSLHKDMHRVKYGDEVKLGPKTKVEVYDAGHLPGSSIFVLNSKGKKMMFTGDFKMDGTRLVSGARFNADDIDAVFMETTYSSRDHPDRAGEEKNLYKAIKDTIDNGGIAMLPVFAVRAAELLMVLDKFGANWPVYLDGMAKDATSIAMAHPEFLRDFDALHSAVDNAIPLYENEERDNAMREPCVILTTGAAMEGGPIVHYMKKLYPREDCSILFTGYQIPKTAGRYLLDSGQYILGAINLKVKMKIQSFDFSAHAGRSELLKFVQKVNPKKVICMHGDYCEKFATEIKSRYGINAVAPKTGDVLKI